MEPSSGTTFRLNSQLSMANLLRASKNLAGKLHEAHAGVFEPQEIGVKGENAQPRPRLVRGVDRLRNHTDDEFEGKRGWERRARNLRKPNCRIT
jgi:hypothetical protein